MKIYVASKSRHWPFWAALAAAGVPIIASWISAEFNHTGEEPLPSAWTAHWESCVSEAASADVTILFAQESERQMGALIEAGACLAAGKWLFLITPHDWSFRHHPRVRAFKTLAGAIDAVMAMQKGKQAREKMNERKRDNG